MEALLCGLGFFLILEGLFPLLAPEAWKKYIEELLAISTDKIRLMALVSVVLGLVLIWGIELF